MEIKGSFSFLRDRRKRSEISGTGGLKRKVLVLCMLAASALAGCRFQIAPQNMSSMGDALLGETAEMQIITPEGEAPDEAPAGSYLTVTIGGDIRYADTVGLFTGLSAYTIEKYSETSTWELEGAAGWGRVLNFKNMYYLVSGYGDNSISCGFSKNTELTNIYVSLIGGGRISGTEYQSVFLRERFPAAELSSLSAQEVLEECQPYIDALGFDHYSVDVYAMDTASLLQLQEELGIYSPDGDAWSQSDECYLLLYRNAVNGTPVFDISTESSVVVLYSPVLGLLSLDCGYLYQEVVEETPVPLLEPDFVYTKLGEMADRLGIGGTVLEVTEIQYGYAAKREEQDEISGKGMLTPCYRIVFLLTKQDGAQLEGDFLVDAVTGEQLTYN